MAGRIDGQILDHGKLTPVSQDLHHGVMVVFMKRDLVQFGRLAMAEAQPRCERMRFGNRIDRFQIAAPISRGREFSVGSSAGK